MTEQNILQEKIFKYAVRIENGEKVIILIV